MVPYDFGDLGAKAKGGHVVNTNHRRVVETWMDSKHKEYFFTRVPLARYLDPGDLSSQMELRNKCQSWSWYMTKVAPLALKHHPAPPTNLAWGEVYQGRMCWRPGCLEPPCLLRASRDCNPVRGEVFRLNQKGQLALGERCILPNNDGRLQVTVCAPGNVGGQWVHTNTWAMKWGDNSGKCVTLDSEGELVMRPCDATLKQVWKWRRHRPQWA